MSTNKYITAIGSRKTPEPILDQMENLGAALAALGFIGRSGHADGADYAFEKGFDSNIDIYLPWPSFNRDMAIYGNPKCISMSSKTDELLKIACPHFANLKIGPKKLHARNLHQVLGDDLANPIPSIAVVAWTEGGELVGGTATAIRLANHFNIPVFNFATTDYDTILSEIKKL